ncbi:hypothetical protein B7Y94_06115 [Candidatus Saccharibacteria bacterium 32-49-12]|nr:MAG: hypothetical protein B7Y94_06115 [Candidatus Saccharibacteria bacterium 32-49-12]
MTVEKANITLSDQLASRLIETSPWDALSDYAMPEDNLASSLAGMRDVRRVYLESTNHPNVIDPDTQDSRGQLVGRSRPIAGLDGYIYGGEAIVGVLLTDQSALALTKTFGRDAAIERVRMLEIPLDAPGGQIADQPLREVRVAEVGFKYTNSHRDDDVVEFSQQFEVGDPEYPSSIISFTVYPDGRVYARPLAAKLVAIDRDDVYTSGSFDRDEQKTISDFLRPLLDETASGLWDKQNFRK